MLIKFLQWLTASFAPTEPTPKPLDPNSVIPETTEENRKELVARNMKDTNNREKLEKAINAVNFMPDPKHIVHPEGVAMDALDPLPLKQFFQDTFSQVAVGQLNWYASYGFIGYQTCAIVAQQWLISKVCSLPGQDAARNGYEITVNDGTDVPMEVFDRMRELDEKFDLIHNLERFSQFNRVFGIRIAFLDIDTTDRANYYLKPFNIDGITPKSYRGIVQVDPYWITPELDLNSAAQPASLDFYEPTWWRVGTLRIHRTHLIIIRGDEVADLLKPSYLYGGIPVTQKIYERVYSAERCANEAAPLLLTKRLNVYHTELEVIEANPGKFQQKIEDQVALRDNYGIRVVGLEEAVEQFDLNLTDLDVTIMTQYQLVAAVGGVPAVELLGTTPKGFNATGEFEAKSYRKLLETIQTHEFTPLVQRHHEVLIRSHIIPEFGGEEFKTKVIWNKTDSPTEKEKTEINKIKADTHAVYQSTGAIDAQDIRDNIIADPDSGYSGLDMDKEVQEPVLNAGNENDPNDHDGEEPTDGPEPIDI